jgi:hypothetical protein
VRVVAALGSGAGHAVPAKHKARLRRPAAPASRAVAVPVRARVLARPWRRGTPAAGVALGPRGVSTTSPTATAWESDLAGAQPMARSRRAAARRSARGLSPSTREREARRPGAHSPYGAAVRPRRGHGRDGPGPSAGSAALASAQAPTSRSVCEDAAGQAAGADVPCDAQDFHYCII